MNLRKDLMDHAQQLRRTLDSLNKEGESFRTHWDEYQNPEIRGRHLLKYIYALGTFDGAVTTLMTLARDRANLEPDNDDWVDTLDFLTNMTSAVREVKLEMYIFLRQRYAKG